MKTRKHKIILGVGIGVIALIMLFILLFIHICSSQAESKADQVESDKQDEIMPEKELVKEEKTEKTEEQKTVEDKKEEPAAEQKQQAPQEQVIMFTVESRKKWQYPGIEVTPETNIIISYEKGEWNMGLGRPYVDAEGFPQLDQERMFRAIAPGALVGKVGNNKEFKVGNYCEISGSNMTGKLKLVMNDGEGWFNDNHGSIIVKIIVQ